MQKNFCGRLKRQKQTGLVPQWEAYRRTTLSLFGTVSSTWTQPVRIHERNASSRTSIFDLIQGSRDAWNLVAAVIAGICYFGAWRRTAPSGLDFPFCRT